MLYNVSTVSKLTVKQLDITSEYGKNYQWLWGDYHMSVSKMQPY